MRRLSLVVYLIGLLIACSCTGKSPAPPVESLTAGNVLHNPSPAESERTVREYQPGDWFKELAGTGLEAVYSTGREANQFTILETVGGGIGVLDFDRDGLADVLTIGGGTLDPAHAEPAGVPCRLFRNLGSFRFREISAPAEIPGKTDYSHGVLASDYNNDGFPDILITCYGKCSLWLNLGDGTFEDATADAGLTATGWHTAAAWADLNQDGLLDLLITQYVGWGPERHPVCEAGSGGLRDICPPQKFPPLPDHLYQNNGNGTFTNISELTGIRRDGKALGALAADLTDDGQIDLYVANDVVGNHLYLSAVDGSIREAAERAGLAFSGVGMPEGSMGVDADDLDGDGLPEVFVTNYELEDNSLYRNLGDGQFQHATSLFGLAGVSRRDVGFGTGLHDFDSDGFLDLYLLNGHVLYRSEYSPFPQFSRVLHNRSGRRFEQISSSAGAWFERPHTARGGAVADLDGDGALDLLVSSLDEPVAVLQNTMPAKHWWRVQLVGVSVPRDPIGSLVTLEGEGVRLTRLLKSGHGYLSQSDMRLTFAHPAPGTVESAVVRWPGGKRERFSISGNGPELVLVEGCGEELTTSPATEP